MYQYWAATGMPPPLPHASIRLAPYPTSSTMPFAPVSALSEPTAASLVEDRWASQWKAKKAKVTTGSPSKGAAAVAPAAPLAPASAPVPSGPTNQTILTQTLNEMVAEEVFEELFGAALAPVGAF